MKLIICVRCHQDPSFIVDTMDAVRNYTDPERTVVMAAVDGRPRLAEKLRSFGLDAYCSRNAYGWGAGLYTLLCESILFSRHTYGRAHFLTIDYDTLFIGEKVDELFLEATDVHPEAGMIGRWIPDNQHWKTAVIQERKKLEKKLGRFPDTYIPGEGVQGGCMFLSAEFQDELIGRGYMEPPLIDSRTFTGIADDHYMTILCRICGYDIHDVPGNALSCSWKASKDPRGLEKEGVKVFHPIKMVTAFGPHCRNTELELRNYFRGIRGVRPIK